MREILFRGMTANGKWAYGDFVSTGFGIACEDYLNEYGDIGYVYNDVFPETIGQYTGLTDKNGTKIFEGDIVKISDINESFVCVWEKDNFEYEFENKTMSLCICGVHKDEVEVIGNIHDNPELLKEREGNENL